MRHLLGFLVAVFMTGANILIHAGNLPESGRFAGHEKLVAETHAASLKLREASLRGTIAKKEVWPPGTWGDNLWCLAALCLNEKTDEANARLLKSANKFIESKPKKLAETSPEGPGKLPWTFFSITGYLRILYLFHAKSPHFPGRLKPETEAAMKQSLWLWVRGESWLAEAGPDDQFLLLGTDSALVNYAWRTPHCLLGSILQNPALHYSDISRQKRWCGLLFHDSSSPSVGSIGTVIGKTGGGRPQHAFWSVQHEGALILQRIAENKENGSYSTGKISLRFDAHGLQTIDKDGWIFAANGKAFAAVRFLDGGHRWDKTRKLASPARFTGPGDTGRILLYAGDITTHGSFERFRESVRAYLLMVTANEVDYRFEEGKQRVEMSLFDVKSPKSFSLPRINGTPIDIQPADFYQSPFLNGVSNGDRITVTLGPVRQIFDFAREP